MAKNEISDYITFPKTFESYRWYKPIIVFILFFIIMIILSGITVFVTSQIFGPHFMNVLFSKNTEFRHDAVAFFFSNFMIFLIVPSLYLASKIVKDRPFSSYTSLSGKWNHKLYFKSLAIPLILFLIYVVVDATLFGTTGKFEFSLPILIAAIISIPLQCIAEEYAFRGFLMQTLGSWLNIPVLALIIQAVIFAVVHGYGSFATISIFILGAACGFFTWKTDGLEVGSALHTANNLSLGILLSFGIETLPTLSLAALAEGTFFILLISAATYYVGKKTEWFGELPQNSQNA